MRLSWAQLGRKPVGLLLNHLIRPLQQRRRDREVEGPGEHVTLGSLVARFARAPYRGRPDLPRLVAI